MRLETLFWKDDTSLNTLFKTLDYSVRFVGGCIRDYLSGHPVHDLDLASTLSPFEITRRLSAQGFTVLPTGIKHGTVTVLLPSPFKKVEITTLRQDKKTDGRHALVSFNQTDWQQDALRRDFTINALYADFDGHIYDDVGGLNDLKNGVLRFIGNPYERISEDYLRLLRFFRFYGRFGKNIPDKNTETACITLKKHLNELSGERIRDELFKIFISPQSLRSLDLMIQWNIFPDFLNIFPKTDVFKQLKHSTNPLLLLASLLSEKDDFNFIASRLKLSKKEQRLFYFYCQKISLEYKDLLEILENVSRETLLEKLFLEKAKNNKNNKINEMIHIIRTSPLPFFPLKGKDLLSFSNLSGKDFGNALNTAKNYWLEQNGIPDKTALIQYLKDKKII